MPVDSPAVRRAWFSLSLRLRLTLLTVFVFVLIQTAASVMRYLYVERQVDASLQSRLAFQAQSLTEKLDKAGVTPSPEDFYKLVEAEPRSILVEELLVSLYTTDGRLLASNCNPAVSFERSMGAVAARTQQPVHRRYEVRALQTSGGELRPGRTVAVPWTTPDGERRVLVCATSDEFVVQLTQEIGWNIWTSIPFSLVPVVVSGWLIAGIAVKPIVRLQNIAMMLRPDTLADRIDIGSTASEVAKLQDRLNDARRHLNEGYAIQEQFAANVAHELKTPLAIVAANADLVRDAAMSRAADESDTDAAEILDFVELAHEESLRLARVCDGLLLLARVRNGKPIEESSRSYDVNEWVMDCVQNNGPLAKSFGVQITPHLIEGDLAGAQVRGDPDLLRILLDNVLRNAVRFSDHNGTVEIFAEIESDARHLSIRVRDQGPGVPEEMKEQIFERFKAGDRSASHGGRGSGIGLQIARGIASLHHATLNVANNPDRGCTFSIRIPLLSEAAEMSPLADAT